MWHSSDLIAFEARVAAEFEKGAIKGPVHLSGGNEDALIEIFKKIDRNDWVFSTYRNHYHALLHGVPADDLYAAIAAGKSMNFTAHRFVTSAIVGGTCSIAVGVAAALKRSGSARKVWCFIGDMAARTGAFHEANQYAVGHDLPIRFIVEDNSLSCDTPTAECWGEGYRSRTKLYRYERTYPHVGIGKWVQF